MMVEIFMKTISMMMELMMLMITQVNDLSGVKSSHLGLLGPATVSLNGKIMIVFQTLFILLPIADAFR